MVEDQSAKIQAGDLLIDPRGHRATLLGRDIVLTGKEFALLRHLAEHPGWVWSSEQLLETVWGYDFGDTHVVNVHVANLRRKLGESSSAPRFIHTVRAVGYRFEAWAAERPADLAEAGSAESNKPRPPQPDAFVGRLPELQLLRDALQAARSGEGRLVMIGGDVGIGKTRLVEELAKQAAAEDAPVLWGLCRERGAAAWEPWPEVLRACLALPGVDGSRAAALRPLLGASGGIGAAAPDSGGQDRTRDQVIEAIAGTLARAAGRRPLVVVLDDVHWADESSLLCLQHLARVAHSQRWLLIATYRDFEVARLPLLGDVIAAATRARGQTLVLRPLQEADVAGMIAHSTRGEPSPALVEAVYRITEGNPFFTRELLRLLTLRGGDIAAISELPREDGIRQVIEQRMAALSADCVRLLELAAVIGLRFSTPLVERSSGLPSDRCLVLLSEAETAQLLHATAPGMFIFGHQLVREVVYRGLPAMGRAALHSRVGCALEDLWAADLDAHAAELAHHFGSGGDIRYAARALSYTVMAGRSAKSRYAWEEAARWLERALELRETYPGCHLERPDLATLYEDLGDARLEAGHIDTAVEAYECALQTCSDHPQTGSSLLDAGRRYRKLASALVLTPHIARATSAYLEAERVLGDPTPDRPPEWWTEWLDVELERCWGHYYAAEFDGLTRLAERIRPFVDARGSAAHRGAFYNCLFIGDEGVNRYVTSPQGLEYAQVSARAYSEAHDPHERCLGLWVMSLARTWLPDHPDDARTAIHRYLRAAEDVGDVTHELEAAWLLAMWHRWHGHVEQVEELAERGLDLNRSRGVACYTPCAKGNLAWVAYRAGDLDQARRLAREALAVMERDEEHVFSFQWLMRWPLLGAGVASGDLNEATIQARALLRLDQQAMPRPLEAAVAGFLAGPSVGAAEPTLALAGEYGYL